MRIFKRFDEFANNENVHQGYGDSEVTYEELSPEEWAEIDSIVESISDYEYLLEGLDEEELDEEELNEFFAGGALAALATKKGRKIARKASRKGWQGLKKVAKTGLLKASPIALYAGAIRGGKSVIKKGLAKLSRSKNRVASMFQKQAGAEKKAAFMGSPISNGPMKGLPVSTLILGNLAETLEALKIYNADLYKSVGGDEGLSSIKAYVASKSISKEPEGGEQEQQGGGQEQGGQEQGGQEQGGEEGTI